MFSFKKPTSIISVGEGQRLRKLTGIVSGVCQLLSSWQRSPIRSDARDALPDGAPKMWQMVTEILPEAAVARPQKGSAGQRLFAAGLVGLSLAYLWAFVRRGWVPHDEGM